ncbi:MAG TPA: hypothetical protein PKY82_27055 [Pyrinomonadaceae bacterium]|nr:hypothetical protein [Pyrinomonadaceae bacterium]
MKKILASALLLGASIFSVPSIEAKSNNNSAINNLAEPQIRVRIGNQPRRSRSYLRTRIVRRGYALYRETYRITYLRNGRVQTRLVSRVRIR